MPQEPEVPEEKVPVVECLDGLARITSKELAPIHSVKSGILQNACSTSPRVVADLVKSALMRIVRLKKVGDGTSLGRGHGRYPNECRLCTLAVLHPGVPVMWHTHIRDLSPHS